MSIEENIMVKKNKRSKTHHGAPRKPMEVLDVIHCRDKLNMTWQAIGDKLNITRAGARYLYYHWYQWAKENV